MSVRLLQMGGGPEFDPMYVYTWHTLYWPAGDAFQAEGFTDGQVLNTGETIPDEGPSGNDLTTTSTSTELKYTAADANMGGQPSLTGSSSNMPWMRTYSTVSPYVVRPYSVVMIFHPITIDTAAILLTDYNNPNRYYLSYTTLGAFQYKYGGGYTKNGPNGSITVGDTFGLVHHVTTLASTVYLDDVLNVTVATGGNDIQTLALMQRGDGYSAVKGSVAFCGIYEGDIRSTTSWSAFQVWALETYGATI